MKESEKEKSTVEVHTRSLNLIREIRVDLTLESLETLKKFPVKALLDSGATDNFIDQKLVDKYNLDEIKLEKPIPVFQSDGKKNSAGDLTGFVDLRMKFQDHAEQTRFFVTTLGSHDVFLGHTWLQKHNPEINWETGEVEMSRCPKKTCGHVHRSKRSERQHIK